MVLVYPPTLIRLLRTRSCYRCGTVWSLYTGPYGATYDDLAATRESGIDWKRLNAATALGPISMRGMILQ